VNDKILDELYKNILDGDFEISEQLAKKAILAGADPVSTINTTLMPAIELVGQKFENKEYFLPDLMRSANAMKNALKIFEEKIASSDTQRQLKGKIVIGTVKGDIHEIGKSIVASFLSVRGFEVIDLGIDVDSEKFINKIIEVRADILAMSALLPITMPYQGKVIEDLKSRNLRNKVKIMVGGSPVTQEHCDKIGADGYADSAINAVPLAEKLLKK